MPAPARTTSASTTRPSTQSQRPPGAAAFAGASTRLTSTRWYTVFTASFLLAAVVSRSNLVAAASVGLGTVLAVQRCLAAGRMRWFGLLVVANSLYWIAYGLAIGSLPGLSGWIPFITTEGRVLVALVPLVGLACARTGRAHVRVLERLFEVVAIVLGALLVAYWAGLPVVPRFQRGNFHGLTATHHAPAFIAGVVLIVLMATWPARRRWPRLVLVALLFAVVLASRSRAGLVGLGVAALFAALWRLEVTRLVRWVVVTAVAGLAVLTFVPRASQTVQRLFDEDFQEQIQVVAGGGERLPTSTLEANILRRVSNWTHARQLISSSPLIGIGPWRYDDELDSRVGIEGLAAPVVSGELVHSDGHTHNVYLQVMTETGLIGVMLMGALWVGMLVALWRAGRKRQHDRALEPWLLAGWCGIGFGLGVSLTDIGLINPALTFPLTLVLGTVLAFAELAPDGDSR